MDGINKSTKRRFFSKFKEGKESECWLWLASTDSKGRGKLVSSVHGKIFYHTAPRLSYYFYKGIDPKKKYVCHTCDNPTCVNPNHLWLGTHSENVRDFYDKGGVKSERHRIGSLIEKKIKIDDVLNYLRQGLTQTKIAKKLMVSDAAISKILKTHSPKPRQN